MIKFNNVSFSYNKSKPILKDFNLNIAKGERICLFAPSGFGKTTILRLIMGLEKPSAGTVEIPENKKITAVFQEDRLLPHKTVLENIQLFGGAEKSREILEALNLSNAGELFPAQLSGGMSRRVAIARALNAGGDIFIFDECFNGIDKENVKKTARLILKETVGKTVITVNHNIHEAELLNAKIINL